MKTIAAFLLTVLAILVAQLTFLPATALALNGDSFTTTENQAFISSVMTDINALPTLPPTTTNPATGLAYTSAEEFGGLATARMAGGFGSGVMPALGVLSIGGSAIYTAYEIGDYFRSKISGDTTATISGAFVPQWVSLYGGGVAGPNGATTGANSVSQSWSAANFGGWGASSQGGVGIGFGVCSQGCWVLIGLGGIICANGIVTANCTGGGGSTLTNNAGWNSTVASILANDGGLHQTSFNTSAGSSDCKAVGACELVWRTWDQMNKVVQQSQCNLTCYNAANTKKPNFVATSTNGGIGSVSEAERACGGLDGNTVVNAQREACRGVLNYAVNPSCDSDGSHCVGPAAAGGTVTIPGGGGSGTSFQPFVLPKPQLDETYEDYLQGLRDKGWVGTATITDGSSAGWLTSAKGRGVPDGTVEGVKVGAGSFQYQYEPLTGDLASPEWPDNPDQVPTATSTITILKTPAGTFDPTAPTPTVSDCSTCTIDWTPLESLSVGSKFPFGVPAWFYDFFNGISFSSSCPTLDIGKPAALGGGTIGIPFCNTEWETTYRPIIFPILEALMTIAGVVFLGGKILGTSGANDE
jgi:hypothetical protein